MAYDLQQLTAAPRQVILSACDAGRSAVRPGEELLGFTAALLYVGAATVISSVASVRDDTAVGIMTEYHRGLTAGDRPAQALAKAAAGNSSARSSASDPADAGTVAPRGGRVRS